MVKHFAEQDLADFVRGVGEPSTNSKITEHIADGCFDCATAVELWERAYAIAANEPSLTPPDGVVRIVKAQFATQQPPKPKSWMLATLVFDNLTQPLTLGVRSGSSDSRHVVFEAEKTMVDLVLVVQPTSKAISLIGQVVDKTGAAVAPRQVAVTLWTETGQPLAEASANEFGEFQMEFAAQDMLRLSVEIAGRKPIRIPPLNLTPNVTHPVT